MSSALADRPVVGMPEGKASPQQRWRALISPPRISALDVARGLAILGMIGAHVGNIPEFSPGDPLSYLSVVHGNSALLFAVLAGVSIALMTGRTRRPELGELPRLRLALLGRGATIFVIGLALEMLGTGVAVILTFYGVMYIAAMPVLRMRVSRLLLLALPIALVGPILVTVVEVLSLGGYGSGALLVLTGIYRFTAWAPLMLVGMALGRLPLERRLVAAIVAGAGAALAVLGTGAGLLFAALLGVLAPGAMTGSSSWEEGTASGSSGDGSSWTAMEEGSWDGEVATVPGEEIDLTGLVCYPPYPGDPTVYCEPPDYADSWLEEESSWSEDPGGEGWASYPQYLIDMDPGVMLFDSVASLSPHSGSTVEIFRSGGLALCLIGILLLLARPLRWVLLPLSALGAMPLTAYSVHVLALFAMVGPGGWIASNLVWALMSLALILVCLAWTALLGRGPLERLTAWAARRTAPPLTDQTSASDASGKGRETEQLTS